MGKELVIPDYMNSMLAESSVPSTDSMDTGGSSVPRISLKGKIFRFKDGGEEVEKVKEDLDVIIVGMMPEAGTAKTFYAGEYNPDSADPPDCSSSNGVTPDSWVSNPISQNCATCPNNKFGSAISMAGKKSKACRDSKRLYLVKAKELKDEKPATWLLNVTVSSLKPFTLYGRELANQGIPTPSVVITRLNFDDDTSYPKLTFEAMGVVNEEMAKLSVGIAEKKEWDFSSSNNKGLPAPQSRQALPETTPDKTPDASETPQTTKDVDSILQDW